MEFISQLTEREDSKQFGNVGGFRLMNAIDTGSDIELSIQASYGHYCSPRETIALEDYEKMELAIMRSGDFVSVSEVIRGEHLIDKFEQYYEGTVYGFVPVELIQELYEELTV